MLSRGFAQLEPLPSHLAGATAQLGWSAEVVGHPPKPRGVWAPIGAIIDWEALRPKGFRAYCPAGG
jgi:hypothetical protein